MSNSLVVRHAKAVLRSGKVVRLPAWEVDSGDPGPVLLLTAAQHGNEVQGSEVLRRFVNTLVDRRLRGKVIAVPFANLPAVRERRPHIRMKPEQPYGDDRGHNMNRTWPGSKRGNDTARVSFALYRAFGGHATHALDLHCWEKHAAAAVLVRDSPSLRDLAGRLGTRFVRVSPPNDCTLGGLFCATGRVGVTYEFSGQYTLIERQLEQGLRLVSNFAKLVGSLAGPLERGDEPVLFSDRMRTLQVTAPRNGLFVGNPFELGQPVRRGTVLGHVLCDTDLAWVEIRCPAEGYLQAFGASRANCDVALPGHHPYVTKGERVAVVARPK